MNDRLREQLNHKIGPKTATALVVLATLAAVLVASTAALGTGHVALAVS